VSWQPQLCTTDADWVYRAKRYERMLKAHGIHPHGGPLEATSIAREKGTYATKSSKKRKLEGTSPFMHQAEIEEQKYQTPQRLPRTPHVKQEPPPMGYQPYMHRHMMSHQPPLMQHQISHFMPQRIGHMPRYVGTPPPYRAMPAMPHNNNFVLPHLPMNQTLSSFNHDQDQHTLNSFDGLYDSDFTNCGSFESLLSENPGMANDICGNAETRSPLAKVEQTDATPQVRASTPVEFEPNVPSQAMHAETQPKEGEPALTESNNIASLLSSCLHQPLMAATTLPGGELGTTSGDLRLVKNERTESLVLLSP